MQKEKVSILIVEDEVLIAMRMYANLERIGYNVLEPASTGEEALASVAEHQPSVILMDIRLPGRIDGIQTAHAIRERYGGIPIIFMTGYSDVETVMRAQQVSPEPVLEKPIFTHQFDAAIQAALDLH
jgi:CheY-like chemotaxis protein